MRRPTLAAALTSAALLVPSLAVAQPEQPYPTEPETGAQPATEPASEPLTETGDDEATETPEPTADVAEDEAAPSADGGIDTSWLEDVVDEIDLEWGGRVQSDLRFRVEEKAVGSWYDRRVLPVGVDRNQNLLGARLTARYRNVSAVVDLDFVLYGHSQEVETVQDLSRREKLDPFRFDVHKLYVEIKDLVVDGFDLTVGQQLALWGVGDQFNPTNNLNADDVEDVLLFGDQQGAFMVRGDYWIDSEWSLTGIMVPVFRPALLPPSGELALTRVDRVPLVDERLRWRIHAEQALSAAPGDPLQIGHPTIVKSANVVLPDTSIENVQAGYRISGNLGGQDIAASYYYGRHDFPVPFKNHTVQNSARRCNPEDANDCINGVLETNVFLHYPRMHAYGLNLAGELPFDELSEAFNSIGYRLEAALIVPERSTLELTNDELNLGGIVQPAGEYDYDADGRPGGPRPVVIEETPFGKWVVGLDYTFGEHVYLNVQWVHGLPDEFGAGDFITEGYVVRGAGVTTEPADTFTECVGLTVGDRDGTRCAREILKPRIGDYLVTGIDITALQRKLLVRLFTIFDVRGVYESYYDPALGERVVEHHSMFTEEGFGAVIYPEVNYNFGNGLEVGVGALVQLGDGNSKFGDPQAGGSLVWGRTRFSF
jgi:hypothetical protein